MKLLLLSSIILLLTGPGHRALAQNMPLIPKAMPNYQAATSVDSAAVLHQLFKRSRRISLLGLTASTGISNGINALNTPEKGRQIVGGIAVGACAGLLAVIVVDRLRFSRQREQEALNQLHRRQPLRPYVQRNYTLALLKATRLPR